MAKQNTGKKVTTGLALGAALVTAIAGGYFLYGPNGKQNRKKVKGWAVKAKGEVLTELENMKEVSEDVYKKTVDEVLAKYKVMKEISNTEVDKLGGELKRHWKGIMKEVQPKAKKSAKKGAKKTTKKSAKKSSKKSAAKKS